MTLDRRYYHGITLQKNGTWYLSVSYKGKRKSKSLNTRNYKVALQLKSSVEVQLLQEVMGITKSNAELTFPELVDRFLTANHAWADSTLENYMDMFSTPIFATRNCLPIPPLVLPISGISTNAGNGDTRIILYMKCTSFQGKPSANQDYVLIQRAN